MPTESVLALAVFEQAVMSKSMVSDPWQFDGDQIKFKDWWREIHLFLKSNRVIAINNKITIVLAQIKEVLQKYMHKIRSIKQKEKKILRIEMNLLKKSRQHLVTRVRQQIPSERLRLFNKERNTLQIS